MLQHLFNHAKLAAEKSKDDTKVGAALVKPNNMVVLTAYNGPTPSILDSEDKFARPDKYKYAVHAEQNIIAAAARYGIATEGCSIYTTHLPCPVCANLIVQAGIKWVYYGNGQYSTIDEDRKHSLAILFKACAVIFVEEGKENV